MKNHISFPSIESFRLIISEVLSKSTYVGRDENNDPIYDPTLTKPTITFDGTVKLHGRNSGVNYNKNIGIWSQSREEVLPVTDGSGFRRFVEGNEQSFQTLFETIVSDNKISDDYIVTIFGEWAGQGVQKGVAISQIDKSFFIFGIKVSHLTNLEDRYWVDYKGLRNVNSRIFNISDYKTFSVTIDFNEPSLNIDELDAMVVEVEQQCPVSKEFGIDGLGEGVVFSAIWKGHSLRFKIKGEKHKVSRTRDRIEIDVEKMGSINEFIDYSVTENRFEQALQIVFKGAPIDVRQMGEVIKWMNIDILKEESDVLIENKLNSKEVNKFISKKVKDMFFQKLNEF